MPTSRSVAQIKANLLKPSLTSVFEVELGVPPSLQRFLRQSIPILSGDKQDKINLLCSEASLPGSTLATLETQNNYHGVTERFAYRRIFDQKIDLTFYVDADDHLPIKFFERWIEYITNGRRISPRDNEDQLKRKNYHYRTRFPDGNTGYRADGLKVIKFERDTTLPPLAQVGLNLLSNAGVKNPTQSTMQYEFVKSFPISITSMPVSYEASTLLKCTVGMTYLRYIADTSLRGIGGDVFDIFNQATRNSGGFLNQTISRAIPFALDAAGVNSNVTNALTPIIRNVF